MTPSEEPPRRSARLTAHADRGSSLAFRVVDVVSGPARRMSSSKATPFEEDESLFVGLLQVEEGRPNGRDLS
jgi:hypothetical protein